MKARVASSTPMMDSSHVVLDVVPLSMVPCHVSVQNKMRPPSIKKEHSIISLYLVPIKSANVSAKEFICSKLVSRVEPSGSSASEKSNKVVSIDDPVSMNAKENQDVSNDEESLGGRKEKSNVIVNFNELDSDEETIAKNMATGIAKRLKNRISKPRFVPDFVQVLRAADQLERDLVQIVVEDSVDSDDGGKAVIREMPSILCC
ncbi:hypothetical protein KIW84_074766 [Lathyrus oleraceus]|uniref:Uncharacterized protein n=1 Tax=Pisum sativum TaxID=3888 RepID=A0A9D4VS38_PEA|nr:hypothetical protein KIW84_074766 [Pisum sativum]